MANIRDIRFLVISGGGAAGLGHGGAIAQLGEEPEFSFDNLEGIAATSVGALIGLLVALRCSAKEIVERLQELDFKLFADGGCAPTQAYRLFNRYGRFRGDALNNLILKTLAEKTGRDDPESITFADMKKAGCVDFHVITTKMFLDNGKATGKEKVFSFETTPDTSVAAAVRASAAAPFYFPRIRLRKISKGQYVLDEAGDLYSDGGIFNNYAIDYFDRPKYMGYPDDNTETQVVNPHTLGLVLLNPEDMRDAKHVRVKEPLKDHQPVEFAKGLVNSLIVQFEMEKLNRKKNRARTVEIDRKHVKLDDFDISDERKEELFQSGKLAVKEYFAFRREMKEENSDDLLNLCKKPKTPHQVKSPLLMWEASTKKRKAVNDPEPVNDRQFSCTIV